MSQLQPHRWPAEAWHIVADENGRVLGKFKSPSPLLREQLATVRKFLGSISTQKGETMSKGEGNKKTEKTNIVWLAGTLKFDPKVFDNNVKALIDVGLKSCIQVSIYTGGDDNGNAALAAKLKRFQGGDFIKVVALLRPYGVKQDNDTWKNNMSVDITEIKNEPPQRQREQARSDDDIPF